MKKKNIPAKTLILRSKILDLNDKKKYTEEIISKNDNHKNKSKFFTQSNKQITKHRPSIDELKREIEIDSIKQTDNKKNISHKRKKTVTKKRYYNKKKKEENKENDNTGIMYMSSINAINDYEKDNTKNNLGFLNNEHYSTENMTKSINNICKSHKICKIF